MKPTVEEENAYRMQLKSIPQTVIAAFVSDDNVIRAYIEPPLHEAAMTEERAREILASCPTTKHRGNIGPNEFSGDHRVLRSPLHNPELVTLDAEFTADELEAIAWWMRNKGAKT